MARKGVAKHGISIRLACVVYGISETCYRYQAKLSGENALVADWLLRLTQTHKRWGFGLCFLYLRNVKGYTWNHKRVYRIYRELELNLRIKPRRRIQRDYPGELDVPTAPNQVWSMDFMSDQLVSGKTFRTFNVIDDYNREGLGIEVDLSSPAQRVIRALDQIIEWRGKPAATRCDNAAVRKHRPCPVIGNPVAVAVHTTTNGRTQLLEEYPHPGCGRQLNLYSKKRLKMGGLQR